MTGTLLLVLGSFLASAVEMVEALTIVLGVGVVRGWRSTLIGVAAASVVLAGLIAIIGPALGSIPIDVLRLVVRGHTTKRVAAELGLSPKTVGHHIERIYVKLGVSTRGAATLAAIQFGLVE